MNVVHAKLLSMMGGDEKLTSKSKVDLARLPPCHPVLKQLHVQRVNYRVALYKRADETRREKKMEEEEEFDFDDFSETDGE